MVSSWLLVATSVLASMLCVSSETAVYRHEKHVVISSQYSSVSSKYVVLSSNQARLSSNQVSFSSNQASLLSNQASLSSKQETLSSKQASLSPKQASSSSDKTLLSSNGASLSSESQNYGSVGQGQAFGVTACVVDGRSYNVGQTFTIPFSGPCIEYTCHSRGYSATKFECNDGHGKCLPLGHIKTNGLCIRSQCARSGSAIGFYPISTGCQVGNKCIKVGESYVDRCFTYQCKETNMGSYTTYQAKLTSEGCAKNAVPPYDCVSLNSVIKEGCISQQCLNTNNRYSLQVIDNGSGCYDGATCRPIGSTWTDKCETKTCYKHSHLPGYTTFKIRVTQTQCEGVNGSCHPIGSRFSKDMHGQLAHNCTCHKVLNYIQYTCNN